MNSSLPQSRNRSFPRSTENRDRLLAAIRSESLDSTVEVQLPGSWNDAQMIRGILIESIRTCGKSRAQIADEMSYLVGSKVTERQLNGFTAESKEDYRWPAELDRAFCTVTGDNRLLACRIEKAGMHVISDEEFELLELGRAFQLQAQAEARIDALKLKVRGRAL